MYQDTEQLIHGVSVSPADFYDNGIVILPYNSYLKLPIIVLELLIMNVGVSSEKSNNCILYRLKRFSNIFALGVILSSIFL